MALPGNNLALSYPPNALVLTKLPAEEAIKRLEERSEDPKDVFEKLEFMKKLEVRFGEAWFRELYESRGTTLYELDTSGTVEATTERAQQLIDHILTTC
jgi:thymidylate kinase